MTDFIGGGQIDYEDVVWIQLDRDFDAWFESEMKPDLDKYADRLIKGSSTVKPTGFFKGNDDE